MDAIDIATYIMVGILFLILAFVVYYFGICLLIKLTAKTREKIWFLHYGIPMSVSIGDPTSSKYYGKALRHGRSFNTMMPTIDDPILQNIADQLRSKWIYKRSTTYGKTTIVAQVVQQGIKYITDAKKYGMEDVNSTPATVLYDREDDCESMSFLFAGIAYNCGLDVVTVRVEGHKLAAVCTGVSLGITVTYNNKKYQTVELTCPVPVGLGILTGFRGSDPVVEPTEDFYKCLYNL